MVRRRDPALRSRSGAFDVQAEDFGKEQLGQTRGDSGGAAAFTPEAHTARWP